MIYMWPLLLICHDQNRLQWLCNQQPTPEAYEPCVLCPTSFRHVALHSLAGVGSHIVLFVLLLPGTA